MDKRIVLYVCLAMPFLPLNIAAGQTFNYTTADRFEVNGHSAFIINPPQPAAGAPWVWYAPTFSGHYPNGNNAWIIQGLLDNGIAVAGIDVGETHGSPAGRLVYSEFYDYATTQANLASKTDLWGQSRGGLMVYNWAAENPEKVSSITGVYPIGDLRSWPGLTIAAPAYGMTVSELDAQLSDHNPIDRLAPLAAADIPIFHIHGDSDTVVPLSQNSQVIYDRYIALGGRMELVVVPGKGHAEIPEYTESQELLDFMVANALSIPEPGTAVLLASAIIGLFTLAPRAGRKREMSRR